MLGKLWSFYNLGYNAICQFANRLWRSPKDITTRALSFIKLANAPIRIAILNTPGHNTQKFGLDLIQWILKHFPDIEIEVVEFSHQYMETQQKPLLDKFQSLLGQALPKQVKVVPLKSGLPTRDCTIIVSESLIPPKDLPTHGKFLHLNPLACQNIIPAETYTGSPFDTKKNIALGTCVPHDKIPLSKAKIQLQHSVAGKQMSASLVSSLLDCQDNVVVLSGLHDNADGFEIAANDVLSQIPMSGIATKNYIVMLTGHFEHWKKLIDFFDGQRFESLSSQTTVISLHLEMLRDKFNIAQCESVATCQIEHTTKPTIYFVKTNFLSHTHFESILSVIGPENCPMDTQLVHTFEGQQTRALLSAHGLKGCFCPRNLSQTETLYELCDPHLMTLPRCPTDTTFWTSTSPEFSTELERLQLQFQNITTDPSVLCDDPRQHRILVGLADANRHTSFFSLFPLPSFINSLMNLSFTSALFGFVHESLVKLAEKLAPQKYKPLCKPLVNGVSIGIFFIYDNFNLLTLSPMVLMFALANVYQRTLKNKQKAAVTQQTIHPVRLAQILITLFTHVQINNPANLLNPVTYLQHLAYFSTAIFTQNLGSHAADNLLKFVESTQTKRTL